MELLKSFDKTKLDLENPSPSGFNRLDTITNFNPNTTGTPTNSANPGAPSRFFQKFVPQETYLQYVKNLPKKSNLLNLSGLNSNIDLSTNNNYSIFDATNLDIEKPGVDGGIPYKQEKDPTVYPVTTQRRSSTTGTSSLPGQGASKFNQSFNPTKTYLDFIKKFI
jgi:hypothetical protein